ncbi:MAG TPA: VIT and VWA domain-containing protein [Polyangia bacterium]|jgi:Ca-activated chloride channel family protein
MNRSTVLLLLAALVGAALVGVAATARADAGVLIPWSESHEPDPSVLALKRMDVRVRIDDQHAKVDIVQIYQNLTAGTVESRYIMPLGPRATVSGFALWEGDERHVGVVIEKQRGRRLFEELTARRIDPGLLETDDQEERQNDFHLRVAPIGPYATARVEVTYEEELPLVSLGSLFSLPLAPRRYGTQPIGELHVELEVTSSVPLAKAAVRPRSWLTMSAPFTAGATRIAGAFHGKDVEPTEDLAVELGLAVKGIRHVFLTHRDVTPGGRRDRTPFGGEVYADPRGYFMSRTILNLSGAAAGPRAARPGRDIVVLLDASLSMQWDKLTRATEALEYFLKHLVRDDRFAVVVFNDEVRPATPGLVPATREHVAQALGFVNQSALMGGTDLGAALAKGLDLCERAGGRQEKVIVAITDGHPTMGELAYRRLGEGFARRNRRPDGSYRARLFVFGVGDDANATLLGALTGGADGFYAAAREGEELSWRLRTFFEKLGQSSLRDVAVALAEVTGIEQILPGRIAALFDGSDAFFVGRYRTPATAARVVLRSTEGGRRREDAFPVALPERDTAHPWIGRVWAKLRIDELLAKIAEEGEEEAWVREIVALAKEHNLATPYTSFIAASRALLRPRDIQPGDPVLRVKTSPAIVAVTAVFPFGLVKELSYLEDESLFETRFLAPPSLKDGTYRVSLILTDRGGRKHEETKSFVIDSKPPTVKLEPQQRSVRAGARLAVVVRADADTRRIVLRLGDGPPAEATWQPDRKASLALVEVPADLPTGSYELRAVAEDFAHNVAAETTTVTVMGN